MLDYQDERGRFEVFFPRPTLGVTRARGHLSHVMALRWIETLDPVFDRGIPISNFHQWHDAESYDSHARRTVTSWAVRRISSCREIHFLLRSKLIAMAVSTVNLATTFAGLSMTSTSSPDDFHGALERALRSGS